MSDPDEQLLQRSRSVSGDEYIVKRESDKAGGGPPSAEPWVTFLTPRTELPKRLPRPDLVQELTDILTAPTMRLLSLVGVSGSGKTAALRELAHADVLSTLGLEGCVWYSFSSGLASIPALLGAVSSAAPEHLRGYFEGAAAEAEQLICLGRVLRDHHILVLLDGFESLDDGGLDLTGPSLGSRLLRLLADEENRSRTVVTSYVAIGNGRTARSVGSVDIEPFSIDDATVLADLHEVAIPRPVLQDMVANSDGHALLISTLLSAVADGTMTVSDLRGVVADVAALARTGPFERFAVVWRRIWGELDDLERHLVVTVAVADTEVPLDVIRASAPGHTPAEVSTAITRLVSLFLLRRQQFSPYQVLYDCHHLAGTFALQQEPELTRSAAMSFMSPYRSWIERDISHNSAMASLALFRYNVLSEDLSTAHAILLRGKPSLAEQLIGSADQGRSWRAAKAFIDAADRLGWPGFTPHEIALVLNRSAWFASKAGENPPALDLYDRSIATTPDEQQRWQYRLHKVELLTELGRYHRAFHEIEAGSRHAAPELGDESYLFDGRLGIILGARGNVQRGLALLEQAHTMASRTDLPFAILMKRYSAEVQLHANRPAEAALLLDDAEQQIVAAGQPLEDYLGHILRTRAELAVAVHDPPRAYEIIARARGIAESMAYEWLWTQTFITEARACLFDGQVSKALRLASEARLTADAGGHLVEMIEARIIAARAELIDMGPHAAATEALRLRELLRESGCAWLVHDVEDVIAEVLESR